MLNMTDEKLNEKFFGNENKDKQIDSEKFIEEKSDEMVSKSSNRKLNEKWDIHFCIGTETFQNIIGILKNVGLDTIFRFTKNDLKIYVVDVANTHSAIATFHKTEFAVYEVQIDDVDDGIKDIYIDTSIFGEFIELDKSYPTDIYIDTLLKKKFYVANGKEIAYTKLNVMNVEGGGSSTLSQYKTLYDRVQNLLKNEEVQKIVVEQKSMVQVIKSISKKGSKDKDANVISVYCYKNGIEFSFDVGTRGSDISLMGNDLLVYPIKDTKIQIDIDYIKELKELKFSYQCNMWIHNDFPLVLETKMGGGNIVLLFIIATRVVSND